MTDLGPFGDPADQPGGRTRHRRSTGLGARIGALFPAGRRPTRKEWVVAATALALIAILGLGWLAVRENRGKDSALDIPPLAPPSATAPPAGDPSPVPPPPSASPPPPSASASPPAPQPDPQPDPPPGDDDGNDDGENGDGENGDGNDDGENGDGGNEESAPRPEPRLVGPADAAGWEKLLTEFCQQRGDNRAVLLPGERGDSDGQWVCVEVTTFEAINLDEPCRRNFGGVSQARQTQRGDARTWRCFDR